MKNLFLISTLLFSCLSLSAEKYALVIAIGDYPEEGGWPDLSSQNDLKHIEGALQVMGFTKENILILQDAAATKQGIIDALKSIENKLKSNDQVFIHFSGHGQQVVDDNGDELDQLDEAIVPYNSALYFEAKVNEGQYLLRDDELGQYTRAIRKKCGKNGQVVLVLDSCHSGTGTRGFGKARGTATIMAADNFKAKKSDKVDHTMGIGRTDSPDLAPMASFFGASARELNYETLDDQSKPVGSLTYAFYSTIAQVKNKLSFNELFDRVRLKMRSIAPRQSPQWEGPKNELLLGGEIKDQSNLHDILSIDEDNKMTIAIGTMSGLFEGSIVEVYSIDRQKSLAQATITKADLSKSIATLNSNQALDENELLKIKIIEKAFAPINCTGSYKVDKSSYWYKYTTELKKSGFLTEVTTDEELRIIEDTEDKTLQLLTREGLILWEGNEFNKSDPKLYQSLELSIKSYTQGKYLRGLNAKSQNYRLKLEAIPVECDNPSKKTGTVNGQSEIKLSVGTCVVFKITNIGKRPAYFSLLDIQPDNAINVLIPAVDYGYTAEEYYLKPQASLTTDYCIEIFEPLGMETLKLMASKETLNLNGIVKTQGTQTRGLQLNPFEKILGASFQNVNTRGAKIRRSNQDEVGTTTLTINIVK